MNRVRRGEVFAEIGPVIARIAAVTAIVITVLAVAVIVTRPGGAYEVNAIFDSSRGLIEGGNVTAGFQKVGTVKSITLGKDDGLPHVAMKIDGGFVLHQGASADIRLTSNVGAVNRVVDLHQGDPEAPRLADGDTLGPSHTDEPVDLDTAVSTLDPKTRADAAALLAGLDNATKGRGTDIARILRHSSGALNQTANVLAEVGYDGAALRSLVHNTSAVVGGLAADPAALGSTAERTATLLRIAGDRQSELRRSARALGPALDSGRRTLENLAGAVPELRRLVRRARPLVYRLGPVARSLPATVKPLRPTLAKARTLVRRGPVYARRIDPAVRASLPLLKNLDPTLRLLNPFLDELRVRSPEALGFFQLAGDGLGDFDANGHLIRFIPRLIQVPLFTNPVASSDPGPGSLDRPFFRTPGALAGAPWSDYASSFVGGGHVPSDYAGTAP